MYDIKSQDSNKDIMPEKSKKEEFWVPDILACGFKYVHPKNFNKSYAYDFYIFHI